MTVTVLGTLIQPGSPGANVYPGELVMVKNATGAPADDATYAIQLINSTVPPYSVNVTVPTGTAACTSNCGSLFLGTPILGFANTSNAYNGGWPMLSLSKQRGCPALLAFFARGRGIP